MKWIRRILIAAAILTSAMSISPRNTFALEIGAGPVVWYAWWQPVFENTLRGHWVADSFKSTYGMCPAFLVGGALTARFLERWEISSTFLWGSWYHATGEFYSNPTAMKFWTEDFHIHKYDFDFTSSYSFNEYFKIFLGVKIQGYDLRRHQIRINLPTSAVHEKTTYPSQFGAGPGAGIGFTVPIGEDFYIILNASAIYMRAWIKRSPTENDPRNGIHIYYNLYGENTIVSLAYVIAGADVTLNLGFRYQFLYYRFDSGATADSVGNAKSNSVDSTVRNGEIDQFYGITFMAVYSISLF